jgi:LacI family transcriptional regulator
MRTLAHRKLDLTAVFATSDEMALGAMTYLHRTGVRLPDELSLVGYDDTLDAVMAYPALTTVHQGIEEMGEIAMHMIEGKSMSEHIILPHSITERDSVAIR